MLAQCQFQGTVLSVKLEHLPAWNESRRKNAQLYNELLANVKSVITPTEANYAKHVYHIYAIRAENRDALIRALAEKDIFCGIHYPVPIHLQEAYKQLGYWPVGWNVKGNLSERFFLFETFIVLSPKKVIYLTDNPDLVVFKVVVF